jgi:hypothetical protein
MKHLPALLAAAAVIVSGPAAAQETVEPRVFTRTGQWQLEAAENECRLARMFTNGTDQIALALERNRADNLVRLVLVSNALGAFRSAEELGYRFMPAGEQRSARYIVAQMNDGQTYYNLGNAMIGGIAPLAPGAAPIQGPPLYDRAAELEYAAGITAIEINAGLTTPVRLETGSLRGAITALQACTDDLLLTWGVDWQKHQTLSRRVAPVGNAWEWIPNGTIGFQDFISFAGGRNPFRVLISAEGRPTACSAQWVSLSEDKNQRICAAIMEHGQFTPALDAAGQPVASYWMVDYMFGLARPPGA